jgi:hypothetical protein
LNLDLDPAQRRLAETMQRLAAAAPAAATGWEIFERVGATKELALTLGLFEWCLVFEALGTGVRDIGLIRTARNLLDTSPEDFENWLSPLPQAEFEAGPTTDRDLLVCAAYAVGIGRRCLEIAHARASERTIGGRLLIELQAPAHRLANASIDLAVARAGLWRLAWGEDHSVAAACWAPAATATCVTAAVNCAHEAVQIFGAAGTSDADVVRLYRAAYQTAELCGSPSELWQAATERCHDRGADRG